MKNLRIFLVALLPMLVGWVKPPGLTDNLKLVDAAIIADGSENVFFQNHVVYPDNGRQMIGSLTGDGLQADLAAGRFNFVRNDTENTSLYIGPEDSMFQASYGRFNQLANVNGTGAFEAVQGMNLAANKDLNMADNSRMMLGSSTDGFQVDSAAARLNMVILNTEFPQHFIDADDAEFSSAYHTSDHFNSKSYGEAPLTQGAVVAASKVLRMMNLSRQEVANTGDGKEFVDVGSNQGRIYDWSGGARDSGAFEEITTGLKIYRNISVSDVITNTGKWSAGPPSTKAIASGAFAHDQNTLTYILTGEGAVADDLDSITGGSDGMMVCVENHAAYDITLKFDTGNLYTLGGIDYTLGQYHRSCLVYSSTLLHWIQEF